jgi:hypothetical protein
MDQHGCSGCLVDVKKVDARIEMVGIINKMSLWDVAMDQHGSSGCSVDVKNEDVRIEMVNLINKMSL